MRRPDLQRVAADAEVAALEAGVGAAVLLGDEVADHLALAVGAAGDEVLGHRPVGLGRADTVDAGDRGDDDDVVAFEQCPGRRVAHPVDLLVNLALLLNVGVGARDIGLRLVVVVVGDEVLDRVLREEPLEFAVQLRGEGLVRREDDRRPLRRLDHLGGGEGLAGAGGAEQHLAALAGDEALDELGDRRRLVAGRLELGDEPERLAALELGPARVLGDGGQHVDEGHGELAATTSSDGRSPAGWQARAGGRIARQVS